MPTRGGEERPFVIGHSLQQFDATPEHRSEALAVISTMPPSESGIATFTLRTFRESEYPVDVFTHFDRAHDYLSALADLRLKGTHLRVYDLAVLPIALSRNRYRSQLFALGNSEHNLPITLALQMTRAFPQPIPIDLLIHDPCLINISYLTCEAARKPFAQAISSLYGVSAGIDVDLVAKGVYGLRVLTEGAAIRSVFVNSAAAGEFVRSELPQLPIHQLFQPVFKLSTAGDGRREHARHLRIGTFGVPGDAKLTNLIIDAFRRLQQSKVKCTLVIAGWNVNKFAHLRELNTAEGIELHDSPSDERLQKLIESVDIAIQLRQRNLGESSGVVPQLLACGTKVIVSDLGSFSEYKDVAHLFDNSGTADDLMEAILSEAEADRKDAIGTYVVRHSPRAFCDRLWKYLEPI